MSRKQELYLMMLHKGIVFIRNHQSQNKFRHWWPIRFRTRRRIDLECYEVAEFLHHVPMLVAEQDFTISDIRFLNGHCHSFYKRDTSKNQWVSGSFRSPVRQLFQLVPENLRSELKWTGPKIPTRTPAQQAEVNDFLFRAVAENSNIETLHNALSEDPDLNALNSEGKTAIQIATALGKTEYVAALTEASAHEQKAMP